MRTIFAKLGALLLASSSIVLMTQSHAAVISEDTVVEWSFDSGESTPDFVASSIEAKIEWFDGHQVNEFTEEMFATTGGLEGSAALVLPQTVDSPFGGLEITIKNVHPTEVLGISSVSMQIRTSSELSTVLWQHSLPDESLFIEIRDGIGIDAPSGFQVLELEGLFEPVQPGSFVKMRLDKEDNAVLTIDQLRLTGTAVHDVVPEPGASLLLAVSLIFFQVMTRSRLPWNRRR